MFDLVADVEAYPQFVPLCTSLRLRQRTKSAEGVETLLADMEVGYKAIREHFTSRVACDRTNLVDPRRICGWPLQPYEKSLGLPR